MRISLAEASSAEGFIQSDSLEWGVGYNNQKREKIGGGKKSEVVSLQQDQGEGGLIPGVKVTVALGWRGLVRATFCCMGYFRSFALLAPPLPLPRHGRLSFSPAV